MVVGVVSTLDFPLVIDNHDHYCCYLYCPYEKIVSSKHCFKGRCRGLFYWEFR